LGGNVLRKNETQATFAEKKRRSNRKGFNDLGVE
jgi:hypothetical protein